jgi:DNA invertase Pin-like site-specific DNA recombinase
MIFTVIAAVAGLERSTIRGRVLAGQKAAKRCGVCFGWPTVDVDTALVRKLRDEGLSWRDISAEVGGPRDSLIRSVEREAQ